MFWFKSNRPLITVDIVAVYKKLLTRSNSDTEPYYYFIIDGEISAYPAELGAGPRVFAHPESMVFGVPEEAYYYEDGEGPYESIRQLKDNSEIFKNLIKRDPKRAAKIFEERFIGRIGWGDFAAFSLDTDEEFQNIIFPLLQHTVQGTFSRDDVSGIHYYDRDRVRVRQLVSFDSNYVFEAHIDVYNSNRDTWIEKQAATTFFPQKWSYSRIVAECEYAYLHRVKLTETKYKGITKSGIIVVFIFNQAGQLQTIYPICEEE